MKKILNTFRILITDYPLFKIVQRNFFWVGGGGEESFRLLCESLEKEKVCESEKISWSLSKETSELHKTETV